MSFYLPEWLISSFSTVAIFGFILVVFRKVIFRAVTKAVEHSFDKKLEVAKAELHEQQAELDFIRGHLRNFRTERNSALLMKKIDAAEELMRATKKLSALTYAGEVAKVVNFEETNKNAGDPKLTSFFEVITAGLKIDETIEAINKTERTKSELYLPERPLALFRAYQFILIHAALMLKQQVIAPGMRDFWKAGSLRAEVEKVVPHSKDGFDKFGETYAFHWTSFLYEEIVKSLRAEFSENHDEAAEYQAITGMSVRSAKMQAEIRLKLSDAGLPTNMVNTEIPFGEATASPLDPTPNSP